MEDSAAARTVVHQQADEALFGGDGVAVPVAARPVVAVQVQRRARRLAVQRQHQPCSTNLFMRATCYVQIRLPTGYDVHVCS
jgi:hypothetical protein